MSTLRLARIADRSGNEWKLAIMRNFDHQSPVSQKSRMKRTFGLRCENDEVANRKPTPKMDPRQMDFEDFSESLAPFMVTSFIDLTLFVKQFTIVVCCPFHSKGSLFSISET
jgi:hypothetical protein